MELDDDDVMDVDMGNMELPCSQEVRFLLYYVHPTFFNINVMP